MHSRALVSSSFALALVVPVLAAACGSSSDSDVPADAGVTGDAGLPGADTGTGGDATGDACSAGAACTTNPGAPCLTGVTVCVAGGAQCADGPPATDGLACSAGLCTRGKCLGEATVSANTDLSTASITPGRSCAAEAPAFAVVTLTATQATVATAPTGDCLAAGDEVMLVNVQGSAGDTGSVGNWELLEVASVSGANVTFARAKTRKYGAAGGDGSIGAGATDQKVELVRVPQFGTLTIAGGITLTTGAWDGAIGGVLALRAAKLDVAGTVTSAGLGFRNGRWSRDDESCSDSVQTESGESIDGPPSETTLSRVGAPGGIGPLTGTSYNNSTPLNAGAGHATAGQAGSNGNGRTVGDPGGTYGAADGTKLTMGSGASGNVTCESGFAGPALVEIKEPLAGGVIALFANQLTVEATGSVTASANTSSRDVSASAGYVYVRGTTLAVGDGRVTAIGGTGRPPSGATNDGQSVKAGDGYVVLQATTVTGTTTPAANRP